MIYEYGKGPLPAGLKAIPATITGGELQRIYQERGELTPAVLVEESRALGTLLHEVFEWNNDAAADEWRLAQARQIVRSVVLVSQPERGEQAPTLRAFVSLSRPDGGTARYYRPIIDVLESPTETAEIQQRLRHELLSLRRRYLDLIDAATLARTAQEVLS